jgi:hypothetical protein
MVLQTVRICQLFVAHRQADYLLNFDYLITLPFPNTEERMPGFMDQGLRQSGT